MVKGNIPETSLVEQGSKRESKGFSTWKGRLSTVHVIFRKPGSKGKGKQAKWSSEIQQRLCVCVLNVYIFLRWQKRWCAQGRDDWRSRRRGYIVKFRVSSPRRSAGFGTSWRQRLHSREGKRDTYSVVRGKDEKTDVAIVRNKWNRSTRKNLHWMVSANKLKAGCLLRGPSLCLWIKIPREWMVL